MEKGDTIATIQDFHRQLRKITETPRRKKIMEKEEKILTYQQEQICTSLQQKGISLFESVEIASQCTSENVEKALRWIPYLLKDHGREDIQQILSSPRSAAEELRSRNVLLPDKIKKSKFFKTAALILKHLP